MGKKMTKKKRAAQRRRQRAYLRASAMGLLVLLGVGVMAGMAAFNGSAKPNRDMQWYMTKGEVEVAAPPMGEGYGEAPDATEGGVPYMSAQSLRKDVAAAARQPAEDETQPAAAAVEAEPGDVEDAQAEAALAFEAAAQSVEPATAQLPAAQTSDIAGEEAEAESPKAEPEPEPQTPVGPVTITVTAAGDCTFGGTIDSKGSRRFAQLVEEQGYDYFFQNVRSLFEADDLTIINLEGPLTATAKAKKHGSYVFKGDPSYANILTGSSVELCNLANNHILDYGTAGLTDTAKTLDEYGVGYCGYTQAYSAVIKGVRVTALGFTKWDHTEDQIAQAVAEARKSCDLLIVNMHWGWERQHEHDAKQTAMGHAAIDAGADLVIGTHPHVYQGIEKYKGRYIIYSLGNFCFAGNTNPADKRCLIFQQSFGFTPGMGMAQAGFQDLGINLIPANVSSVRDMNDFQPTIMPAEEGAALLKAVAGCSVNFNAADALWMKDNYLVSYGLIKREDEAPAESEPATAELGEPDAAPEAPGEGSVT